MCGRVERATGVTALQAGERERQQQEGRYRVLHQSFAQQQQHSSSLQDALQKGQQAQQASNSRVGLRCNLHAMQHMHVYM